MEESFDFDALLRNNEKKHKRKPPQFSSVAIGVQKRLENSLKDRKSNRRTIFDRIRDIPECDSPQPGPAPTEAQLKVEHRRQQLEKWKEEKEKKKKEELAQKKKPFIAGIPRQILKFVPPPPVPKPSTSGRVTRSQTKANFAQPQTNLVNKTTQSFAPKNAQFRAPELKTVTKFPVLALPSKTKTKKAMTIAFEPVLMKSADTVKQTRLRTAALNRQAAVELSINRNKAQTEPKNVKSKLNAKLDPVTHPRTTRMNNKKIFESQSSSSGSDVAPSDIKKRIQTPGPTKSMKEKKNITPKVLHLESTTSEEKSSSDEKSVKCKSVINSIEAGSTDENLNSESTSSVEDLGTVRKPPRKSSWNNFSLTNTSKTSKDSPDSRNSDVEFVSEQAAFKTPRKSLTPKNKKIPKSESRSEEKLRSPKSPMSSIECPLTPEQIKVAKKISPCVTLSRGKDNARREMKWKMNEGLLDDDACERDSVEYFRRQLASETERMRAMCLVWDKILEQAGDQMPEAVQELVLSAVGQARLLMSQKMQQFASLVERCAKPDPSMALVTPGDLRGFWDMIFMQVDNVDMRFQKLEELRARNWVEQMPVEVKKKAVRKAGAKTAVKPTATSRLRDLIAAARKARKDQETEPSAHAELAPPAEPQKTFEAGFFCVRSPVKSPAEPASATPRSKSNLLKAVLSSEAKKSASRQSASFAMLRASIFSKNVECEGVAPLQLTPQINLYATPGRSILKSNNVASAKKSSKKSIKLVLFNESDTDLSFTSLVSDKFKSARDEPVEKSIDGIEKHDELLDSAMSSMDIEKPAVNKRNQSRLFQRQNAVEGSPLMESTDNPSPIMTRRRKSMRTLKEADRDFEVENDVKSTKRSSRKKKSKAKEDIKIVKSETSKKKSTVEEDVQVKTKTPRQRNRKADVTAQDTELLEKTPKRSSVKKALQELEVNVLETGVTPKRSTRRRRTEVDMLL